jgi:serine/threonine-protein kinase
MPPQRDPETPPDDRTAGVEPNLDPRQRIETGSSFGRYRNLHHVGSGGMASVFKADDPVLGRAVALKLIRGDDPTLAGRLLLEARAQARIEHEHVCRIYEAGVENGRPFIAMPFIEGRTLRQLENVLTLEQKLQVMKQVAEGVHAAHRAGLVHRDLKPANVIVERGEDGRWFPYVMDFGLAREVDAPGATVTGVVLGTPWYMSPEQARGDSRAVDRRSDVYALGATLYELAGGRPPFEGDSNVTVVMRLLSEEPVPLRRLNPSLPRDVQTIAMKCLEKDPARRYDSARALAEDLGRFLDGEPIQARPASALYRLSRRAQKQRVAVATAALALILVAGFAAAGWRARASARQQAQLAAEFAGTVRDVEWIMRVAHMAPLHDVGQEKAVVRERLRQVAERMRVVGSLAEGPGEYALGRGQLLLGDAEAARVHLERAWNAGARGPEVAYALGVALGRLYERELALADSIGNKDLREAKRREIQAALRDPAVAYLRRSAGADVMAPEYVEGLLALHEKRYAEALAKAAQTRARMPWLYEASLLEGDVHAVMSREKHETGDAAGSRTAVAAAEGAYRAAAAYARSEPEAFEGLCQIGLQRLEVALYARGELASPYQEGRQACETALVVDSERAEVLAKLSNIHRFWAHHLLMQGREPFAALDLAADCARRAVALDPRNRRAHGNLGVVYRLRGEYERDHGLEASASLQQAFTSLQKAVELSGADAGSVNDLGNAYVTRGQAARDRGGDPREDFAQAIAHYDKALERVPDFGYAHANRGSVLLDRARYELEHGIDPTSSLQAGVRSLERAVALLPSLEGIHTLLAEAHGLQARFQLLRGDDPSASLAEARRSLEAAARINAHPEPSTSVLAGNLALLAAQHRMEQGQPPTAFLAEAAAHFRSAVAGDPRLAEASRRLGETELLEARWRTAGGQDPAAAFSRAAGALAEAVRKNPKEAASHAALAELHRRIALWKLSRSAAGEADVRAGLAAAERALELQPSFAEALMTKGGLLRLDAEASRDPSRRRQLALQSEQALQQVVAANAYLARECEAERQRLRALSGT